MLFNTFAAFLALVPCGAIPFKRLVNGKDVDSGEPRPSVVWLRKGIQRLQCGGVLLFDTWVLTAASCLNSQIHSVIAGCDDRTFPRGNEQTGSISALFQHPDYNETTMENDVGLIRLAEPLKLNKIVQPLPYITEDVLLGIDVEEIYDKQCRILGWGLPNFLKGAQFANPLKELVIQKVDDTQCTNRFSDRPSSLMCFEPFRRPELSSTCSGDQGGPLICKVRTEWFVTGIISPWNTDTNCTKGFKGATKVLDSADWIRSVITGHTPSEAPIQIIDVVSLAKPLSERSAVFIG